MTAHDIQDARELMAREDDLRDCLARYDEWHINSAEPLEEISRRLINAAKGCGWPMTVDCVDWARERLG